jgi:hypothetical protein
MPHPDDSDVVYVKNVEFHAYKPVEVANQAVADKLSRNPWFTAGDVDAKRHEAWKQARVSHLTAHAVQDAEHKIEEI